MNPTLVTKVVSATKKRKYHVVRDYHTGQLHTTLKFETKDPLTDIPVGGDYIIDSKLLEAAISDDDMKAIIEMDERDRNNRHL